MNFISCRQNQAGNMLSFLKNHPFGVEAFFKRSLVLTFAIPKNQLNPFIPECLSLDSFDDKWGFIAIAMVQTKDLRPKGFPTFLGHDFFLIGYRVFVRYKTNAGKSLRGLYILKSETDKKKMEWLGNAFTHYNYTTTDITHVEQDGITEIRSKKSGFYFRFDNNAPGNILLPPGSPFQDWKEARRFAGPLPFTFTYNPAQKKVLIIEGVRENWVPAPLKILDYHFSFLDSMNFQDIRMANAFVIENIPYYWKKGKTELW